MTTFTITTDNNITAFATPEEAQDLLALGAQSFANQKELAKLAAAWPSGRLAEIWNSFAGVAPFDGLKPVKKFTDRKVAVNRIWQAIQKLAPAAQQGAQDAPEAGAATTETTPAKDAPKAKKGAKAAKKEAKRAGKKVPKAKDAAPREGSKKQIILDLLQRKGGATLEEIMKATDWQAHSVRGFISGNLTKKMGLVVESTKNDAGERTYRIAK